MIDGHDLQAWHDRWDELSAGLEETALELDLAQREFADAQQRMAIRERELAEVRTRYQELTRQLNDHLQLRSRP